MFRNSAILCSITRLRLLASKNYTAKYHVFGSSYGRRIEPNNIQKDFKGFWKQNHSIDGVHIVRIRGLDLDVSEKEIIDFFRPLSITPVKVNLSRDISGRTSGFCEVEFATQGDAVVAMRKRNAFMGNKFIRLSYKLDESMKDTGIFQSTSSFCKNDFPSGHSGGFMSTDHIIKIRNLPLRITDQAVYEFFASVQVKPISIKHLLDENGCRSSITEVIFASHEDCLKAMCKNNLRLGNRKIELIMSSNDNKSSAQDGTQMSDSQYN